MDNYQSLLGSVQLTVSETMQQIDKNSSGILFLVDDNDVVLGSITDGDIRRYLLSGGRMMDESIKAANKNPRCARTVEDAKNIYHNKNYIVVPIVDDNNRIIDLYCGDASSQIKQRSALNIPVVINAGGKGTRLEPYTKILPKPLIPVGEYPIIELIMKEYQSYDCNDFHIIVNYKKDLMKAYFADCEGNYNITWYDEDEPLGTGGGLSLLKGVFSSTFVFANCDALLKTNYERMLEYHKENKNVITMICAYKNIIIPYGVVEMGVNGVYEELKEKPLMSFLTNTGIYIVEPEVVDDMVLGERVGFPDVVENQRKKGKKVGVFPISENDWMDMGQISELEKMRHKLYGE